MVDSSDPQISSTKSFLERCASIDLEIHPKDNRLLSFAGVRSCMSESCVHKQGNIAAALTKLDNYCEPADFLLGHNIIDFDIHHLENANKSLQLLKKLVIDTLWLNPLAFPQNPYHHLVKHYQDGRLQTGHINDPELDAKLVLEVLSNQIEALSVINATSPSAVTAYHYLTTQRSTYQGFDAVFAHIRKAERPKEHEILAAIPELFQGRACNQKIEEVAQNLKNYGWPLAYALSWISVAGGNSVLAPWVLHQFPEASQLIRQLRDTSCADEKCNWCGTQNDPNTLLKKWFGFNNFRQKPTSKDGQPLQELIVRRAIQKSSVLGILPTGTGKSVCYQLPALSQFEKTGALTVVISPLVALMTDQVKGMENVGITPCTTINGMLSLPERRDALDKVRLGDIAILLISPEQLRSPSVRSVLKQREIGYWVLDEAHCISKWGHDFRPDYRYVARYIREYSSDEFIAPVICLTATAKPEVIREITDHFQKKLNMALELLDGGALREKLIFEVIPVNEPAKHDTVSTLISDILPHQDHSGAIIYCSTRKNAEQVAEYLEVQGLAVAHYHAGLPPDEKREVQERFASGELRVIAATNAFGMGIDKPDIRLVVHADIPASLENYLQEAGRAGRDQEEARCVLLFNRDDIERQFKLAARSRLNKKEISAILRAIRNLSKKTRQNGEVIATPGEMIKEERDQEFVRDSATDDTRIKTAVAWLEEATLLRREENRTSVFSSSLKIQTQEEADQLIDNENLRESYKNQLKNLVGALINAPMDKGISTDDLGGISGFTPTNLRKALSVLEALGIAANDTAITIFVHVGVKDSSNARFQELSRLEDSLISTLQELAPDMEVNSSEMLNLRVASQVLRDKGFSTARPDIMDRLIRGIAVDGKDENESKGSFLVRKVNRETMSIKLLRNWKSLAEAAKIRRNASSAILKYLEKLAEKRGKDIQVETTLGKLLDAVKSNLELVRKIKDPNKLMDRALLWLHEQQVVTLGQGLTVFRPAMTIHLEPGNRPFTDTDFEPLSMHYEEQTLHIHIMAAYAKHGIKSIKDAQRLSQDYFKLSQQDFLQKWLSSEDKELRRQTTPESWHTIVENLNNAAQQQIVRDDRIQTNVLILAGPGSGKTRVLVHRIAYLIRVRREDPRGILTLVYNRHAATEIRKRLHDLIGDDALGVTISTCHGFAMRIVGATFAQKSEQPQDADFEAIMAEAVALLRGDGLTADEAEAQRDTLIEGYRWILVDEYQDIAEQEYNLIAAVAGRTTKDPELKLSLMAVGDDDQNIYSFKGASVEFIRRFEEDYRAKPRYLLENYRSTKNIIRASNLVIESATERMKTDHDIKVNHDRKDELAGGMLEKLDPVGRGRVQILKNAEDEIGQAILAIDELERLSKLIPDWNWANAAVIAREWKYLDPARSLCEAREIPVQTAKEELPNFWRLRETQTFIKWLRGLENAIVHTLAIKEWIEHQPEGSWWSLLQQSIEDMMLEFGEIETDRNQVLEWLAEWGRDVRQQQSGLLLLSAHKAKGLEFDHVAVLDGSWYKRGKGEDPDASRRLYYVAMTRAKSSLTLLSMTKHPILAGVDDEAFLERDNQYKPDRIAEYNKHAGSQTTYKDMVSECRQVYATLAPKDVFMDFAGRLPDGNPALAAIEQLEAGDPLRLEPRDEKWFIQDNLGKDVGCLASGYRFPDNADLVKANVHAILTRNRDMSSEEFRPKLKRDEWSVVLPELVFRKK